MGEVTVEVRIPVGLRSLAGRAATVRLTGRTVGELLADLARQYPDLGEKIVGPDGNLRDNVNVYRNGEDIRYQAMLDTPLAEGDTVQLVSALAGG